MRLTTLARRNLQPCLSRHLCRPQARTGLRAASTSTSASRKTVRVSLPVVSVTVAVSWCLAGMLWSYSPPFLQSTRLGQELDADLRGEQCAMVRPSLLILISETEDMTEIDAREHVKAHDETRTEHAKENKIIRGLKK